MPWTALTNGINVIEKRLIDGVSTPVYQFTRSKNVEVPAFTSGGNAVAIQSAEDAIKALYDRTNAASASNAGIAKITATLATDNSADPTAASIGALKTLDDAVMKTAAYSFGSYSASAAQSLATLGTDGKVPAAQLPSYIDDVVLINWNADASAVTLVDGQSSTAALAQTGVIYVDPALNRSYRYVPAVNATPASYVGIEDYTLTKAEIESVLGPATKAADNEGTALNGYMTGAQVAKLDETYEVYFYNTGSTAPTPTSTKALLFEVVSTDSTT